MRKTIVLAVALVLGAAASQASVRFGGGAHGGLSFSSFPKPSNELFGLGFGGGAHGDLNINEYFGVRLNLDYTTFASDKSKLKQIFRVTDGAGNRVDADFSGLNTSIFGITANAIGRIPTGSAVTPYGIFGLGLHIGSTSDLKIDFQGNNIATVSGGETGTNFGLNFGAGSEFRVGATKLFFEAKYVLVFTEGSSTGFVPLTFGVVI